MPKSDGQLGFTLIEIIIAVAVVAILATIAFPSYLNQVRDSRRAEGKSLLLQSANRQERFYSTTSPNTYAGDMTALGFAADPALGGDTGNAAEAWYQVSVVAPTAACPIASCFVLQAVPIRDQVKDTECGTLRIDSLGRRFEGGTGTVDDCW